MTDFLASLLVCCTCGWTVIAGLLLVDFGRTVNRPRRNEPKALRVRRCAFCHACGQAPIKSSGPAPACMGATGPGSSRGLPCGCPSGGLSLAHIPFAIISLGDKGYLIRVPGTARGIVLTERGMSRAAG